MAKHKLKLTTRQVNKLYALTGPVDCSDKDIRDIRNQLSNILDEADCYTHYQPSFSIKINLFGPEKE